MFRNESYDDVESLVDKTWPARGQTAIEQAIGQIRRDMGYKIGKIRAEQSQVENDLKAMKASLENKALRPHTQNLIARPAAS